MGLFRPDEPQRRPLPWFIPTSPGGAPPAATSLPPFVARQQRESEAPWRPPPPVALPSLQAVAAATSLPPVALRREDSAGQPRRPGAQLVPDLSTARRAPVLPARRRREEPAAPRALRSVALPSVTPAPAATSLPPLAPRRPGPDGEPRRPLMLVPASAPAAVARSAPLQPWRPVRDTPAARRPPPRWLPSLAAVVARSLPPPSQRPTWPEPARTWWFRRQGALWLPTAAPATPDLPLFPFLLLELDAGTAAVRFEGPGSASFDGTESVRFADDGHSIDPDDTAETTT